MPTPDAGNSGLASSKQERRGWPGRARPCGWTKAPSSLQQHVLAVLHRQHDARAVVEAVAVLFGEVVDALARGDVVLGEQRLPDRLAEFRRAGLCLLQRDRNNALQNQERIIGMAGELAAAVGAVFGLIGLVQRQPRL